MILAIISPVIISPVISIIVTIIPLVIVTPAVMMPTPMAVKGSSHKRGQTNKSDNGCKACNQKRHSSTSHIHCRYSEFNLPGIVLHSCHHWRNHPMELYARTACRGNRHNHSDDICQTRRLIGIKEGSPAEEKGKGRSIERLRRIIRPLLILEYTCCDVLFDKKTKQQAVYFKTVQKFLITRLQILTSRPADAL